MTDDEEAGSQDADGAQAALDRLIIEFDSISDVALHVKRVREGIGPTAPDPARAAGLLRLFARDRENISDLLEIEPERAGPEAGSYGNFERLDATVILAVAALQRPVKDAAQLAIKRWERESGTDPGSTPLTNSIVHDVTAQRTVAEVAEFVRECRREGQGELVRKALDMFVGPESGRGSLDKALFYITLRGEYLSLRREMRQRYVDDPARLLESILRDAAARAERRETERDGLLVSMRHLSPSEEIVADWVDAEIKKPDRVKATIELVANLLIGGGKGARSLARRVGRSPNWEPVLLCKLCARLARHPDSKECFTMVLASAAADPDVRRLANIVKSWRGEGELSGTLKGLLAEIVAAAFTRPEVTGPDGTRQPSPAGVLDSLEAEFGNLSVPDECRALLRIARAEYVTGRSGSEVAEQLGKVEGHRDLWRAAQVVNESLTRSLFTGQLDNGGFADYLRGLAAAEKQSRNLVFWAVRALADFAESDTVFTRMAPVIGDIAARLYDLDMANTGFDLIERCLENEQAVTPEGALALVEGVRGNAAMAADDKWKALLGATVGRWAEVRRRDAIIDELGERFGEERDAIMQPAL